MLNSLEIKNFRNLKELKINSLGNVNLITGKNNTGKSTLLEAIAIYAAKGNLNLLYELFTERDENYRQFDITKGKTETNIKTFSSLFYDRAIRFMPDDVIYIGSIVNINLENPRIEEDGLVIRFVKFNEDTKKDNEISTLLNKGNIIIADYSESNTIDLNYRLGLEIRSNIGVYTFISMESDYKYFGASVAQEPYQFVRTINIDKWVNERLWSKIILTDKENYVIEALRIIDPDVERIAFIDLNIDSPNERTAVVKLKTSNTVVPLKSMGDGINRILTIILALVNSDNGYLLIDEFENGLHHSVQEKLWEIIFYLSKKLNVQVFATTHSEDCIRGFEEALNGNKDKLDGKLIRLDLKKGVIRPVEFNSEELKIVSDGNIEIR